MATSATPRAQRPGAGVRNRNAPRSFGDVGEAPRKPMAAGRILVVGVVCLMLAWLLNAPGVKKTAYGQPLGWRRSVATFFAGPMADLSHFLHADRPREWIQSTLGREGDDDINTKLPSPTTPAQGTPNTVPTRRPAFSPAMPLTVWVGGDSLSITPGESIENFLGITRGTAVPVGAVDGHVSTGLARPEVFNWPDYLKQVMAQNRARLVILTIGSNDDQSLTGSPSGGTVGPLGSPGWIDEYRRRAAGLMDQVVSEGRTLLWIGNPPLRNFERSETRYKLINDIIREEAAKRPRRVYFVDIYPLFLDGSGAYADYLDGVQMRTGDGTHFTRAGADRIAQAVFKTIDTAFDLSSWQKGKKGAKEPTTATTSAPPKTSTR